MASDNDFLLTKIIATLGPASAAPDTIEKLIQEGVRTFRINFSQGTFEEHETTFHRVRQASEKTGILMAVLGDLCGPKIRTGEVVAGGVMTETGRTVLFQRDPIVTTLPEDKNDPIAVVVGEPMDRVGVTN
ncbi:pyruvate kinase [Planctomycetota bacterium]